ncbi:MAG: amidohydrolase family protein [Dehalococcoidia bacterium]|jgi:predicted TIM-barrel fold metal-dependent hydrolase|nr:amidohydrolase family protein [Dehalococcoidia bacterium]
MPIIDSHLHLFRAVSESYPRTVYPGLAEEDCDVPAEKLIAIMENTGVDKAIVVPLGPEDHYLAEIIEHYPGKFAGVGVYDGSAPDQAKNLDTRIRKSNIQGIRIGEVDANPDTPDDPHQFSMFPLLKAMAERNLRVWFYAESSQVQLLEKVLDVLPELIVVFNHCGFMVSLTNLTIDQYRRPHFTAEIPPPTLDLLGRLADRPNTYIHFSGQYAFSHDPYPYADMLPVADFIYHNFGPNRMLWASDFPWIVDQPGYAEQLALVDHLLPNLTQTERQQITGGTAESLFEF